MMISRVVGDSAKISGSATPMHDTGDGAEDLDGDDPVDGPPGGLPARSSLWRIRSAVSAPVSRRPMPAKRSSRGASTRSENGWSSSLVSSLGASVIASRTASEPADPLIGSVLRVAEREHA